MFHVVFIVRGRETDILQPEKRLLHQLPFWMYRQGAGSCGNTWAELAPTRSRGSSQNRGLYPARGAGQNRRP